MKSVSLALLAALLVAVAPASVAQDTTLANRLVESLVQTARLPGFSMAVLHDGEVRFARGHGFADLAARTPADSSTRYRLASVSKVVTATALGRLVQESRVDLDAPVSRYVPDFPGADAFTVRQLSGHLSGIAHYQAQDRMNRARHWESVTTSLAVFRDSPRAGAPGAQYAYSTHGFTLLSAVIEAAAGSSFLDYLAQGVFPPLGMVHTGPDDRTAIPAQAATLYTRNGWSPVPVSRPEDPSYKWAGGGLMGAPVDLVRMGQGYLDGFISPAVRDDMWTTQEVGGEQTGVGVAWRIGQDFSGRRMIHHAGAMEGARTVVLIYPEEGAVIATATNVVWTSSIERNAATLYEAIRYGRPGPGAPGDGTWSVTGTWEGEAAPAGTLTLRGVEGTITTPPGMRTWFQDQDATTLRLFHVRDNLWALVTPYGLIDMTLDLDGSGLRGRVRWSAQRVWNWTGVKDG